MPKQRRAPVAATPARVSRKEPSTELTDDSAPDAGREESQNMLNSARTEKDDFFARMKAKIEQGKTNALSELDTKHAAAKANRETYRNDINDLFTSILGPNPGRKPSPDDNNNTETSTGIHRADPAADPTADPTANSTSSLKASFDALDRDLTAFMATYKAANELFLAEDVPGPIDNTKQLDGLKHFLEKGFRVAKSDIERLMHGAARLDHNDKVQRRSGEAAQRDREEWDRVLEQCGISGPESRATCSVETGSEMGMLGVLEDVEKSVKVLVRKLPVPVPETVPVEQAG